MCVTAQLDLQLADTLEFALHHLQQMAQAWRSTLARHLSPLSSRPNSDPVHARTAADTDSTQAHFHQPLCPAAATL